VKKRETIYCTENVLRHGIEKLDNCEEWNKPPSNGTYNWVQFGRDFVRHVYPPFIHLTKESAIAHAEELRQARVVKLKKSLKRMEQLSFSI